jgi:hypothetical protein
VQVDISNKKINALFISFEYILIEIEDTKIGDVVVE